MDVDLLFSSLVQLPNMFIIKLCPYCLGQCQKLKKFSELMTFKLLFQNRHTIVEDVEIQTIFVSLLNKLHDRGK